MNRTRKLLLVSIIVLGAPLVAKRARANEPRTLTLDEALTLLDRHNPDLAQLRARVDQADGVARGAMSAMLPGLVATGGYARNRDQARFQGPAGDIVIQPLSAVTVAGTVRVPLFAQSAYWDFAQARDLARAQAASFEAQRNALRGAFVQACWMEHAAESVIAAADRGLVAAREHADSAERGAEAGTTTKLAVLQARSEVTRRETDLTEARSALGHARLALGALLGQPEPTRVTMPPVADAADEDVDHLVTEALGSRRELAARADEIRAAERGVTSAWMRLSPGLSGSFSWFASDEPYVTGKRDGWRATVDATWALYDGGFGRGKRREAEAVLAGARSRAEAARVDVAKEIRDAALELAVARDRLGVATAQAAVAEETARTARRGFQSGVSTSLEVVDALDRQTQAAVALEQARAGLGQAKAALRTARGIAW